MLNDEVILAVNAPQANVDGPYIVVHKDCDELWAIVALKWSDQDWEKPTLGVRWFPPPSEDQGTGGFPSGMGGNAVWFIIPDALHKGILASLPLDVPTYTHIMQFLAGEITGEELQAA